MKRCLIFVFLMSSAMAQDLQNRTALHMQADLQKCEEDDRCRFVSAWSITNLRAQSPNNTNIFAGLGWRNGKKWWVEGMVQKQWNAKGGLWSGDVRFRRQLTKHLSIYIEPAVFLSHPAFYEFVIVEQRLWKGLAVGTETENTHRLTKQSIAAGPRGSYVLLKRENTDFAFAWAYRFSPTGKDELRFYLNLNRRFRR